MLALFLMVSVSVLVPPAGIDGRGKAFGHGKSLNIQIGSGGCCIRHALVSCDGTRSCVFAWKGIDIGALHFGSDVNFKSAGRAWGNRGAAQAKLSASRELPVTLPEPQWTGALLASTGFPS